MENKEFELTETEIEHNPEVMDEQIEEVKYVDKSTLHITEQCIKKIMYKPVSTLFVGMLFSAAFIAMMQTLTIVLGVFILGFTLFVTFVVKDFPTLDIYSDFALIYKLDSHHLVRKVMYDDVEEWTCKDNEGKSNTVMFKLKTGEIIYKDTFQSAKAYGLLRKLMGDKESRVVAHRKQVEKNKKMKTKFKLPFKWPFGNKK